MCFGGVLAFRKYVPYGELLALLVYLTWLLHRGLGFESLVVPWRKIYHSQQGTNMYVDAPLLVHVS